MTRKGSKKGSFKVDVFDCTVYITVTENILPSINYYFKINDDGKLEDAPSAYFYKPDNGRIGKYYLFFDIEDLAVDIVNHEKSHLVEQILLDRDIKPIDEIRSYLDGCVSHKLDSFFKKRKIKIKNKR